MIFVTGGTGLVGTHLLYDLASQHKTIRALKRGSHNPETVRKVFLHYNPEGDALFNRIEWVDGDLTDICSLLDALDGVKDIYHCAALVSFLKKDRNQLLKINGEGTANLVNAALDRNIRKFGHISSTATIGQTVGGAVADESILWKNGKTISNYSISKYNAEQEVWRGVQEGLDTVIINPGIVVGPGNRNRSSNTIFKTLARGLKYYPQGANGFVDVRDVSRAIIQLMQSTVLNERFLVIGANLSFRDYFTMVATEMGHPPPSKAVSSFMVGMAWRFLSLRRFFTGKPAPISKEVARNVRNVSTFSTEKIKKTIGFEFTPMADTIANAVAFYRAED